MKKLLCLIMALFLLTACGTKTEERDAASAYLEKVDTEYGYSLALKMETYKSNEALGYRTAGSKAEFETGEMLKKEMESIGLTNVVKDEFTLDGWEFEKAQLMYADENGNEKLIELGGYQMNFVTDGFEEFTLIDAGEGTMADLENLDVEGKVILININQRENWWVNYPAYEAYLAGAEAVLCAQDGGYAEISDDALNAQDICGPDYARILSISMNDANRLRALMNDGEIEIALDVNSTVIHDTKSYNIVGMMEGESDQMIMVSAHYDSYFNGFQDDNAAIALMMSIAKGLVDSGYKPKHTIVFCAMAAEEWGVSNSRYDWSTGAYNEIFNVHPEWAGRVIADINFELPAMNEGESDQIRSSYELKTFLEDFKESVPAVEGVFEKGIEVICPTQTWSDDFSLSIAGIPSTVTALRGGFAQTHYHSQFDNSDTYSEAAFRFHQNMYGMLLLSYDELSVTPLDFTNRLLALKETSTDEEIIRRIDEVLIKSAEAYDTVKKANENTDIEKYAQLNSLLLETFKQCEDDFVRLTWEDVSQFPHEHSLNNIDNIESAINCLEEGDIGTALDEYLWAIDNNWYAYDFSKETYEYFTDYVLNQPKERLLWGYGRVQGHNNLYDVIHSLMDKENGDDVSDELEILRNCLESEKKLLDEQLNHELESLDRLENNLDKIIEY